MADYAIGLSFHKAHRTLVRCVPLVAPSRYFASRTENGIITLPTLETGEDYRVVSGVTDCSFSIQDNNQEFRLLGDDGWSDSVITGASVRASCTTYFMKDIDAPAAGSVTPTFKGGYDEGFEVIQRCRRDKSFEVYFEMLKEMGRTDGATGNYIYDFAGFNAVVTGYSEQLGAEGLTQVQFELSSRGRAVFGVYDNGANPLGFSEF